jgi:hypothetical protein
MGVVGIYSLVTSVLEGWTWGGGFTGVEAFHEIIVRLLEVIFGKGRRESGG